ncbi:four helix bundle protein [Caloranaerobacter azorensis DSM 13643]|uniref:Four helix bundle protein n=1 Tax=Caloranaerobacter azorensis DSM 13643 TaxID=1121264 RepID=A0A1M5V149_9FIRM|nr:four helix bundle protein [Caloranaerobacter azorensis]SHH68864.1 four helix bundle protein [Caloranaerobacter azorensis DSM 13643]
MNKNQSINIKDFRNLKVWQKAIELSDSIYEISNDFPKFEQYAIKSQIIRSCTSISANIAEGNSQFSLKRELNHINIAIGSVMETRNWLIIASRRKYITQEQFNEIDAKIEEIAKMLYGYRKKLLIYLENESEDE